MAASLTVVQSGPMCVTVKAKGAHPAPEKRPNVPLRPVIPQKEAGIRIDPPPSVPMDTGHKPVKHMEKS